MTSKTSRGSSSAVIAAAIFDHTVQEDEINLVTSVLWFYGIKAICLEAGKGKLRLTSILLDTTPSVASMFYLSYLTHSTFKSSSSIARLTLLSVFFS